MGFVRNFQSTTSTTGSVAVATHSLASNLDIGLVEFRIFFSFGYFITFVFI